jgi:ribonuclease HII
LELDKQYPEYHIAKHKGYGTKEHMEALEKYGPKRGLHRFSYKPIKKFLIEKVSLF